ncbi:MAG: cell filamentation protein Fic [Clostridia bacterium]|nr:cell filamentation protein Fic [Clostridia bacterium]
MENTYEQRNSKYCYLNSEVLINKLNIQDAKDLQYYEAKITAAKSLGLRQMGITGNFDKQHFMQIHGYLFEDIYPFAGKLREENIAKGEFRFAMWEYIETELENLLAKLKNENYLQGLNKIQLAKRLAYYLSELNVLHCFREGNGRTNREFIRQLALKNGYYLNLKKVPPQEILEASIESIVNTTNLEKIIEKCLDEI